MKILHLLGSYNLPRNPNNEPTSGVVRVALEVARRQAAMGHQVTVASIGLSRWTSTWDGVQLVGLKSFPWAKFSYAGKYYNFSLHLPYVLYTWLKNVEIIHAHGYSYLRFLRARGKIVHYHNDPFYRGSRDEGIDLKPADFQVISLFSDAQIAVSQFVGKELSRGLAGRGNVHVIYNGVDCASFSSDRALDSRALVRSEWNIPEDGIVILFSGALIKEKGVIYLARAFYHVSRRIPNLYLVVAGSSKLWGNEMSQANWQTGYEEELKNYLQEDKDAGRVLFLGKVSYKDMPLIYNASDLVVVPSIWQEAFSLATLEAMAANLPVIASRIGGLVEIVNTQNGIIVEPGDVPGLQDAITRLATDTELRKNMGRNSHRKAECLTWELTAERIEQVYQDILVRK